MRGVGLGRGTRIWGNICTLNPVGILYICDLWPEVMVEAQKGRWAGVVWSLQGSLSYERQPLDSSCLSEAFSQGTVNCLTAMGNASLAPSFSFYPSPCPSLSFTCALPPFPSLSTVFSCLYSLSVTSRCFPAWWDRVYIGHELSDKFRVLSAPATRSLLRTIPDSHCCPSFSPLSGFTLFWHYHVRGKKGRRRRREEGEEWEEKR